MNRFLSLIACCAVSACMPAFADEYPTKPIRIVVPFAPGGTVDAVVRILSPVLSRNLGQSILVDNKAGGGGVTATNEVLRSPPDGYTIAATSLSTIAANPAINPSTPYGPADLTAIVDMAATATMIAVNPRFPAKNFQEFVAELKRNPSKYSYASSGMGGIAHLQMEVFKSLQGVFVTHIPYRGSGPALVDTASGQVDIVMDAVPSALTFVKSGQLRPIVVASPKRLPIAPDTPTFAEVGLAQMNGRSYYGLVGPKGMPAAIVAKINAAVRAALDDPNVRQRLEEVGASPVGGTPGEFAAEIKESFRQLKQVVDQQKLSLGS